MSAAARSTEPRSRTPQSTPAEIRPAPLSCRAARPLAAPKLHVTSKLQYYMPEVTGTDRQSPRKINRQPRRLESTVSPTKQTPALQINRQQMRTLHPALYAGIGTSRSRIPTPTQDTFSHLHAPRGTVRRRHLLATRHSSLATAFFTTRRRSNRHSVRLENAISHGKQTLGTLSNRHFLQVSAGHQRRTAATNRSPQAASNNVSNRQWQILEINVNLSKQTIAPRSNRHKNAFIASPFSGVRWTPPESCHGPGWGSGTRFRRLENGQFYVQDFLGSLRKSAIRGYRRISRKSWRQRTAGLAGIKRRSMGKFPEHPIRRRDILHSISLGLELDPRRLTHKCLVRNAISSDALAIACR